MAGAPSAAPEPWQRLLRPMLWAFLLLFGSIALFVAIVLGFHNEREYRSATPTSATIGECKKEDDYITFRGEHKKHVVCQGTWNFRGQRYRGEIDDYFDDFPPAGTEVQIKTNGRKAFSMTDPEPSFLSAYVVAGFLGVFALVLIEWEWRARRRNRRTRDP